jgi:hypothetical protein
MKRSLIAFASIALAASAAFVVPGQALAQRSTTRGLNVGAHLSGASLKVEDGDPRDDGAGGGIHIGYGINRTVELFLQLDGAGFMLDAGTIQGEWTMAHADLGARFHFASTLRRWVPYLQVALTGRGVTVKDAEIENQPRNDVAFGGGGFSGGGGLLFYLTETLALDAELMLTAGQFTEIKVDNVTISGLEIDATSSRFSLGLSWWP